MKFFALTNYAILAAALAAVGNASPTPAIEQEGAPTTFITSNAELNHWLATTDANITWLGGKPPIDNPLAPREPSETFAIFCTTVSNNRCTGQCYTWSGNGLCLTTPGINCISATNPVKYCFNRQCSEGCLSSASCTHIADGFCYTPSTNSIWLP